MNVKIAMTLVSMMKVVGHILVACFVTGLLVFFAHDPKLVFYMPVVNIVTSALIKYFSITPDELPTIDSLPPQ